MNIQCRHCRRKWCEDRILIVRGNRALVRNQNLGQIDRYYDQNDIESAYTKVSNWRKAIKLHTLLEYQCMQGKWAYCKVVGINGRFIDLKFKKRSLITICRDSDLITPINTNVSFHYWYSCSAFTYVDEGRDVIPNEALHYDLKCPISMNFFVNPVVLSCCGVSVCELQFLRI